MTVKQTSRAFDGAYCYLLLNIERIWATTADNSKASLSANMSTIMHDVLGPLSTLLHSQTFEGKVTAPAFNYSQLITGKELVELQTFFASALNVWPAGANKQSLESIYQKVLTLTDINRV